MNTRDDETIAAETALRDLLVGMINKPLMANLESALAQHSFEVNAATSKAIVPLGTAIKDIKEKQPEISDEVEEKLNEFSERALTAMAKCPAAVASVLSPGLTVLNEEQRLLGETQHAITSDLKALMVMLGDQQRAHAETQRVVASDLENLGSLGKSIDESVAKHAERLTEFSTRLDQLERAGIDFAQRTSGQLEQLEISQREYRTASENRMAAIEAAFTVADLQRRTLKKLLYGGLVLSGLILTVLCVDVVVTLVH